MLREVTIEERGMWKLYYAYCLIPIILYRKLKKNYIEKIVRESVKRNLSGKLLFDKDIKLLKGYEYLKVEVN